MRISVNAPSYKRPSKVLTLDYLPYCRIWVDHKEYDAYSVVLGPFGCFLKGNRCRYDESLPLKEDYDMTLQQLNMERVVLRVNAYHYLCKQSENVGGCATYRNRDREKQQLYDLQRKWGTKIVKIDTTNKGKTTKEKRLDYNPIIRVPIKGV